MVRLKHWGERLVKVLDYLFQFLNGTIKATATQNCAFVVMEFQFLNGTIKASASVVSVTANVPFQFLNGTIKANQTRD